MTSRRKDGIRRAVVVPRRVERDVAEEIRFHIDSRIEELVRMGMSPQDARDRAESEYGDTSASQRELAAVDRRIDRQRRRASTWEAFARDVGFAVRGLARRPAWTAFALLTLSLGIGANTAVFSLVDKLLLHPTDYPGPERIVVASLVMKSQPDMTMTPAASNIRAWRASARAFEHIEGVSSRDIVLRENAEAVVMKAAVVTPTFSRFAGAGPIAGRDFLEEDAHAGAAPVVILSDRVWRSRFGRQDVVGRTLDIEGRPHTVIGVYPASLRLPATMEQAVDLWLPLGAQRTTGRLMAIGRMKTGVTMTAARADLDGALRQSGGEGEGNTFTTALAVLPEVVGFRSMLLMLSGAVALVLLIACANVAHMILASTTARERELAVRAALGAGRGRLLRMLVTEGVVLAAFGCVGGAAFGWAGLELLIAMRPDALPEIAAARIDLRVLAVTAGLSLLTGVAFGLVAGIRALRQGSSEALRSAGQAGSIRQRFQGSLVTAEIAISAVLLVAATILVRGVMDMQRVDPGFRPDGLHTMHLQVSLSRYATFDARNAFYTELASRVSRLPGVSEATVAGSAPPGSTMVFGILETPTRKFAARPGVIPATYVRPEFFRVLGATFISGSGFGPSASTTNEVVINETLARSVWPGGNALNQTLRTSRREPWLRVVGVVKDIAPDMTGGEAPAPMLYLPVYAPVPATLIVRADDGANPIAAIRHAIHQVDPFLSTARTSRVSDDLADRIARPRFAMLVLTLFTSLAVVLSGVGLYGVLSYAVARRTREIGIRRALGASQRQIHGAIVAGAVRWVLAGAVIGTVAAAWASKLLPSLVSGVQVSDPLSFAIGGCVLLVVSLLACLVPLRRASLVDPIISIRAD